jgi:uncharacterized protein (DUF302 family)
MKYLIVLLSLLLSYAWAEHNEPISNGFVVSMAVAEGLGYDEVVESMKMRANTHNMMFVAHQPLSAQLKAMGKENVNTLEIFQFCDPAIAGEMVKFNPMFAAYMPCRIAMVADDSGALTLYMLDIRPLMADANLPADLLALGKDVDFKLRDIMQAGANGEL